jgi:two-component system OmpR family response regulator
MTPGLKVLVVDDNDDIRLLMRRVLQWGGFEVAEADRGQVALDLLAAGDLPAVTLLDVQMPDMDGWDTLAAIRADPATADLPVILCTVKGRPVDVERGWSLGCDGYLTKPFDVDEVVAEVHAVVARDEPERSAVRAAGRAEARRLLERTGAQSQASR